MGRRRHRPARAARAAAAFPELLLLTDVCLCEYTSHGHCGILRGGEWTTTRRWTCSRARRLARRGGRRRRVPERHDGRPRRRDPRRASRDADRRVLGEVRVRVLRPVPRGGRLGARVRRPPRLPDGSRQRARGAARVRARSRRGRRRAHGQAGAAVPRRHPRGARPVRRAARRVQRVGRVRDGEGRCARGASRRARGRDREPDGDQARRRRPRRLVLDEGARAAGSEATRESELWRRAQELIPGGVNSPVRAMRAVGLDEPLFVRRGVGLAARGRRRPLATSTGSCRGGRCSSGTRIRRRVDAVVAAAREGTSFGAATEREVELAAEIVDAVPSVERVRLVSSGTEASMSAIRLARGFTRRDRVLKFAGCYHGHVDALLAEAGSGLATLGIPTSLGVPPVGDRATRSSRRTTTSTAAAAAVARVRRGARVHHRRARRGEHGRRPAGAGVPRVLRAALRRGGRAARVRRGDHRLPRRARRRAGAVRRDARPDDPRQDPRRRPPARRVRRPRRRDGGARADRAPSTRRER